MDSLLDSYRVLDLTDEKGLLCSRILGDMGADVIKIEKQGGDKARAIGPFYKDDQHPERSLYWFFYNFNKRGITLNVEKEDGQAILRRLIEKADFMIESYPPGYLDRLGVGYEALKKINPGLIFTSITPFGQDGPYKDFKTSDLVSAAAGGLVYILGEEDRPPVRISAEQSYCLAGAQGAIASLMALSCRHGTGEGQHADVSIAETMTWPLTYTIPYWDCLKQIWGRAGSYQKRTNMSMKMLFPCKDGYVNYRLGVAALWGRSQKNLVEKMNEEGFGQELKDIDWASIGVDDLTQEDHDRWIQPAEQYFMQHTREELYKACQDHDFMLAPVNSPKEVCDDPQLAARDFFVKMQHPELDESITYPGSFYKSTETEWKMRRRAPLIGEHNVEIYEGELGFSPEQIEQLKQGNVI